jgi:hypothetical protein
MSPKIYTWVTEEILVTEEQAARLKMIDDQIHRIEATLDGFQWNAGNATIQKHFDQLQMMHRAHRLVLFGDSQVHIILPKPANTHIPAQANGTPRANWTDHFPAQVNSPAEAETPAQAERRPTTYADVLKSYLGDIHDSFDHAEAQEIQEILSLASQELLRQRPDIDIHVHKEVDGNTGYGWWTIQFADQKPLIMVRRDVTALRAILNAIDEFEEPKIGDPLILPRIPKHGHGPMKLRWDEELAAELKQAQKEEDNGE